jgi:hypothetical protein
VSYSKLGLTLKDIQNTAYMLKGDVGELTSPVQDRTQEATQITMQNPNPARFDRHRCTLHLCYLKPSLHPPLCAHAALWRDSLNVCTMHHLGRVVC